MSTYCAPCLADLALVREAVTSVSGTAACVAHAVLLTHPGDSPQRRLERLADLRAMAEGKLATASAEEVAQIELIVQEYALAGAMDMTVPLQQLAGDRAPRPPKSRNRRGRDRGPERERGPERGPRPTPPGTPHGAPSGPAPTDAPASEPSTTPASEAPASSPSALSGAETAPTRPEPDNSQPASAAPDLSGAETAPTRSEPDNSQPAPQPAPEPAPAAPGQQPQPPAEAPVGE